MSEHITRREAMKIVGAASLLSVPAISSKASAEAYRVGRQRVARVAHLTDIHVQPELQADQGMIACLHHVQSLKDKPQCIVTGGDSVMDSYEADDARTQLQWNLWKNALRNECSLPVKSCIGNHDIWGWNRKKSKTTGEEPNYGKKRAVEMLQLENRYYSFDLKGENGAAWHFVILDSIQQPPDCPDCYRCLIDDEQFDWLQRDLRDTDAGTPIAVVSHAPIMTASLSMWAKKQPNGDANVEGWLVHSDALKMKDLFAKHRNVKLCLSGHIHRVERVDYNGVAYVCSGAVCGNWWNGRRGDCDEGYTALDLFDDGTFDYEYFNYGWKAAKGR